MRRQTRILSSRTQQTGESRMSESTVYRICVKGQLAEDWSDWFDGLSIASDRVGETVLTGPVRDQAALFGILYKVHSLNPTLISVNRIEESPLARASF